MSTEEMGVDRVERKSKLERNGIYTKKEYDLLWRRKFREAAPVQIPSGDRGCVSPIGGLARPANQGARK
jgi:hypothetical protein